MKERAILVSVAPEFASKIADGSKTVELRRRFPEAPTNTWIYFYATLPVGALLGRARVAAVDSGRPTTLWRRHAAAVGIDYSRFNEYFEDRDTGFAVRLTDYEPLKPVALSKLRRMLRDFVAPQSYRYLDVTEQRLLLEVGGKRRGGDS